MNDRKNVVVGLFVLGGAILLGAMIVEFKAVPIIFRGVYTVKGHLPSARGIREGKRVHMDGIDIGYVRDVTSSPDGLGVWVDMQINTDVEIPNEAVFIAQQSTVGDLYLDFQTPTKVRGTVAESEIDDASGETVIRCTFPDGVPLRPGNPVRIGGKRVGSVETAAPRENGQTGMRIGLRLHAGTAIPDKPEVVAKKPGAGEAWVQFQQPEQPPAYLPDKAEVEGRLKGPELLPEDLMSDFREAMKKFGQLDTILANLKELTEPRTAKDVDAGKQRNLWTTLEQFERTAKAVQDQLKKPTGEIGRLITTARQAATDLRKTLAKADKAFETVTETGKTFQQAGKKADALIAKGDALIAKLSKDSDEVRKGFENLNGLVTDARGGKGTAGKLLTDDELHRALVTLVENLNTTADNFNRLVTMLREEGVFSKEK